MQIVIVILLYKFQIAPKFNFGRVQILLFNVDRLKILILLHFLRLNIGLSN
jgi:hypothetical protein